MQKDIQIEERDRYRPLMCLKQFLQDFILDCEKIEKKDTINLSKEIEGNLAFVDRQK